MAERAKAKPKAKAKKAPKGATGSRGKVAKVKASDRGDNSDQPGQPSKALIKSHHEKLDGVEERMSTAKAAYDRVKGEHRAAYAVVKQDGIDVEAFKLARKLHSEDHGVVVVTYSKVGTYLDAIKSPLAIQMDLFQDIAGNKQPEEPVLAGAHAFSNGEPRANNPHKAGSQEYADWDGGWMEKAAKTPLKDGEGATIN